MEKVNSIKEFRLPQGEILLDDIPDKPEYERITSLGELPSNKIVYQMDSGFWYDWDLSKKSEDELKMLFHTNVIFKKKENK